MISRENDQSDAGSPPRPRRVSRSHDSVALLSSTPHLLRTLWLTIGEKTEFLLKNRLTTESLYDRSVGPNCGRKSTTTCIYIGTHIFLVINKVYFIFNLKKKIMDRFCVLTLMKLYT